MRSDVDAPPRKVIIGTMVHAMWGPYPGIESRLNALVGFIDRMVAEAKTKYNAGLDLAVLPECAVTGEPGQPDLISFTLGGKVLEIMGDAARRNHAYVIVPMTLEEDRKRGLYTNSNVLLDRDGEEVGNYRKVHLAGLAGEDVLEGGLMPGKGFPVFDCDFGKLGIQVCFDMAYEDGWEALARKGAEIVAWPSQWSATVEPRCRAHKYNYYIVSSTWKDNASIYDPTGNIVAQTTEPSGVLVERIDLTYALIDWQPKLKNGRAFDEKYGEAAGYRYRESEDRGIFWSNDPRIPIMQMVRELGLELHADCLERTRQLQDRIRGGPPSLD